MKPSKYSLHRVPAHVAAFHRLRRLFGVRHGHVLHRGRHYPVNAHWHEACTEKWPHLAGRSHVELRAIQDDLLDKSNHVPLTKEEHEYLRAANRHFDVRTCIDLLKGRDHREFGFDGVDQLEFSRQIHPCGCWLIFVSDHHKGRAGVPREAHPHYPTAVCDKHLPHRHDLGLLYRRVMTGGP